MSYFYPNYSFFWLFFHKPSAKKQLFLHIYKFFSEKRRFYCTLIMILCKYIFFTPIRSWFNNSKNITLNFEP